MEQIERLYIWDVQWNECSQKDNQNNSKTRVMNLRIEDCSKRHHIIIFEYWHEDQDDSYLDIASFLKNKEKLESIE